MADKNPATLKLTSDELAFCDALTKPQTVKNFNECDKLICSRKGTNK